MAQRIIREWVVPLILALALSLFARVYIGEARSIPTSSMEPTLQIGDVFWLEKVSIRFGSIDQGDVVVFWPPEHIPSAYPYIKRVIGVSGDTVQITDGQVYVNGTVLDEPYALLSNDNLESLEIPHGHLFVLGDNRGCSADSRAWGLVTVDRVIGKAVGVVWPIGHWRLLR